MKRMLIIALACVTLAIPALSGAQDQVIHHVYTNATNVRHLIHDVERESNSFRETFERRYHSMFISNYRRSDEAMKAVQHLDQALEKVNYRATYEKPMYVRDNIKKVVENARKVDRLFKDPDQILATMFNDWKPLRDDIENLAQLYELPGIDG